MADQLRLLARELAVPTAQLRVVLGTGWVRLGSPSPVFNGRLGPLYADRANDPTVGIRSMSAVSCVDIDAEPMIGVTVGAPRQREGQEGPEWDVEGGGSDCWWDNDSQDLLTWLARAVSDVGRTGEADHD